MKSAEPNARLRKAVRGFYAWLGSLAIALFAPFVANALIDTGTLTGRIAGVAAGVLGWVPMVIVVATIISRGDEFQRRIHTTAIAISFGGAFLLLSTLVGLVHAHFIAPPDLSLVWLVLALIWLCALLGAKWYYERQR